MLTNGMRVQAREPRWPSWSDVLAEWTRYGVPDVEVVSFQIGKHSPWLAWDYKQPSRYIPGASNPQKGTARHLAVTLRDASPDATAAFKLVAFCRHYEVKGLPEAVLSPALERQGYARNWWWNANAKYVLPLWEYFPEIRYETADEVARRWNTIIAAAAQLWRKIAEELVIIRIPEFMDHRSEEYRAYSQHLAEESERREREEYERLKRKFEAR